MINRQRLKHSWLLTYKVRVWLHEDVLQQQTSHSLLGDSLTGYRLVGGVVLIGVPVWRQERKQETGEHTHRTRHTYATQVSCVLMCPSRHAFRGKRC